MNVFSLGTNVALKEILKDEVEGDKLTEKIQTPWLLYAKLE